MNIKVPYDRPGVDAADDDLAASTVTGGRGRRSWEGYTKKKGRGAEGRGGDGGGRGARKKRTRFCAHFYSTLPPF